MKSRLTEQAFTDAWTWAEKLTEFMTWSNVNASQEQKVKRFLHLHTLTLEKLERDGIITKNKATRLSKEYDHLFWWSYLNDSSIKSNERIMAWRKASYANYLLKKAGITKEEVQIDAIY